MAKTMAGGEILFIEALKMKGTGRLRLTGQLGGVMRESAEAAMSFIEANYAGKAEDPEFFEHNDIHIHVPAGAVPKDGPSAGVAIACTIASLLFDKPVRNDVAMTGEITLTGRVLAHRRGQGQGHRRAPRRYPHDPAAEGKQARPRRDSGVDQERPDDSPRWPGRARRSTGS